eukprot:7709255-Pyramimonas_sp.AAC.1
MDFNDIEAKEGVRLTWCAATWRLTPRWGIVLWFHFVRYATCCLIYLFKALVDSEVDSPALGSLRAPDLFGPFCCWPCAIGVHRVLVNVWPNNKVDATKCVVPLAAFVTPAKKLPNMPVLSCPASTDRCLTCVSGLCVDHKSCRVQL